MFFPDKAAIASLLWSMKHKASEQLNRYLSVVNMIPAWYARSLMGRVRVWYNNTVPDEYS